MGRKMKRSVAFLLLLSMVIGCFVHVQPMKALAAEVETEETLSISFVNKYAEAGTALTTTVNATENVTYNWYVGGIKIDNKTDFYVPTEADFEKWIQVDAVVGSETASAKMYFSKLPVVYIETEGGQAITSKENYINAMMKVQGNAEFKKDSVLYDNVIEIRGRGNSTWAQPKKPYRLKLDKKTDMFGMGEGTKSKHWVLLANYLDESLMRNTLAYNMSGEMGMEHLSTVWVDVIMNGEYVGNYQFCENIRVDEDRVDVFDWESFAEDTAAVIAEATGLNEDDLAVYMAEESMQWITSGYFVFNGTTYKLSDYETELLSMIDEDYGYVFDSISELSSLITGGYILELDEYYDEVSKFKTNSNQPIMFKNPEFVNTNTDMMSYVQTYVQAFENAVQSADYTALYDGETVHYSDLYDFDELIDYWLVTEIFYNEEINKKSTYMYKPVDEKMIMGPIWDMDWSSGAGGTSAGATNQWATNYFSTNAQSKQWYKDLVKDPYFLMNAQERYWEIRNVQVKNMLDVFEVNYDYLKESGQADGVRWGKGTSSFANDYNTLKNWMNSHVAWMDAQMQTEDSLVAGFFTPSSSLGLSLMDKNGTSLSGDLETLAPADAIVGLDEPVILKISNTGNLSGTAKIFVNGKLAESVALNKTSTEYTISAELLNEAKETKNVIEVKIVNSANTVVAENYITVKESDCVHSFGDSWKSDAYNHWRECLNGCGYTTAVAKHEFEWIVDCEATKEADGIKHEECTTCGYKRNENTTFEYVEEPKDPSDSSKDIPVDKMVAISESECDCSQTEGSDDYILDGNAASYWHTKHGTSLEGTYLSKRWIGVSLNEAATVRGIRFLPRQNNGNGQVSEYKIQYRATDDGEWIDITSGTWAANDGSWKYVGFESVTAKQVRIVGVHTYSNGQTDRHMTCAEFRVVGYMGEIPPTGSEGGSEGEDTEVNDSQDLPIDLMTATAGNSHGTDVPSNVVDEKENTVWHTDWAGTPDYSDHWLQIELSEVCKVDGLRYLPRIDSSVNGMITEYEIYTSLDGVTWEKAAAGKWETDKEWKSVSFTETEARYVKLVTIDSLGDSGRLFSSAAEIRLTGTVDGTVVEPPVVEAMTVAFDSGYAEVGKALSVKVTGVESAAYSWKVAGNVVSTEATYTPTSNDLEKWIEVSVSAAGKTETLKMYCSKLPVVYIDTEGGQAITSKENYIDATIKVQGNSQYNESGVLYEGATEIRGRGNSTWSQPKKPYRLKLDKKSNMFDMGKSKHWVLLANYLDESLLRNTLAYDLSGSMGMEQMSTVWVGVVMNGEYVGNYQFCENIRVDDTRVDIFDWEGYCEDAAAVIAEAEGLNEDDLIEYMAEESMQWITSGSFTFDGKTYKLSDYESSLLEMTADDYGHELSSISELSSLITGGYILELDEYYDEVSKFKTNSNQPIMFKNPEFVNTNTDMMNYVQTYVQAFENAVQSADYTAQYDDEVVHYSELYDFDALVDYWLISEIFYNEELNKKSTYMYKDVDGLMLMGPIWDMDWSSGAAGTSAGATNQWATNYFSTNAQSNQWYKNLVKDPYFLVRAQERYWEIRDVEVQDMLDVMDDHYAYLVESGQADYETWLAKAGRKTTFEADYNNLRNWMNSHITWMDGQMATEDTFDAAFMSKSSSLKLTLTGTDGSTLEKDTAEKAPADVLGVNGKAVNLKIAGTNGSAKVYVNGKVYRNLAVSTSGTTVEIPADVLDAAVDTKNVVEVKVYNNSGSLVAANYVTFKTYEDETSPDVPTTPVTSIFDDVSESDWFADEVQYVYDKGIMTGVSATTFEPETAVTRATIVQTLYKLEGKPAVSDFTKYNSLNDTLDSIWWKNGLAWALNEGVAKGDSHNNVFNPDNEVTREDLATFIYRYAQYKGVNVELEKTVEEVLGDTFVNSWAKTAFAWAIESGLIKGKTINGVSELAPQVGATRAELATIMMRFYQNNDL